MVGFLRGRGNGRGGSLREVFRRGMPYGLEKENNPLPLHVRCLLTTGNVRIIQCG